LMLQVSAAQLTDQAHQLSSWSQQKEAQGWSIGEADLAVISFLWTSLQLCYTH
jgi:hypothetical protein